VIILEELHLVSGTMEFNKSPGRDVFLIDMKPGTPVTDNLRKLQYEFAQQKPSPRPNKAEVSRVLDEQVALAEEQKAGLVVAPVDADSPWRPCAASQPWLWLFEPVGVSFRTYSYRCLKPGPAQVQHASFVDNCVGRNTGHADRCGRRSPRGCGVLR
jgi:hypothetical protein